MTQNTDSSQLQTLPAGADGGPQAIPDEEFTAIKDELRQIALQSGGIISERRAAADAVRFCTWEGQSPDGRKHKDALDGRAALPFEGASDARCRLADMTVNERVMVLVAAALRQEPSVTGLELNHMALGHKLGTVLKWVLANKLGASYVRELVKLANYQEGDCPGAAVLGVWWNAEPALEMRQVTLAGLRELLIQTHGLDPAAVAELEALLYDPSRDAETAQALQRVLDHLTPKRARKMVKELRETQSAEYPAPYLRRDEPALCAYRLFEEAFLPVNAGDPKRPACWYLREWLTEAALRTRNVTHRYTEAAVEAALEHEGETGFPIYTRVAGGALAATEQNPEDRKGLYEVWTRIGIAVNEDNIPGLYYLAFHMEGAEPFHDRRLLEYAHGEYPLTWFGREYLSPRLLDTRGVPELAATEQFNQKLLTDSFNDHTSLATVPPLLETGVSLVTRKIVIGPLKHITQKREGQLAWMSPPAYPQANQIAFDQSRRRMNEYFGRISAEVPSTLAQLHMQHYTTLFLASLADALTQLLQLCQQFMSDEELALITGDDGVPVAHSRAEIQGKFQVKLVFDPRHLDMEYLSTLAEMIKNFILPIDTESAVLRQQLLGILFSAIAPWLAKQVVAPSAVASGKEIQKAKTHMTEISAGVEPSMTAAGENYGVQLNTILENAEGNPEYAQKLTPMSRKIFQAHLEHLLNQVEQQQNAVIGRQVGQPVLGNPQLRQLQMRVQRLGLEGN